MSEPSVVERHKVCPACQAQLHPVAGRCKQCKRDVSQVPVVSATPSTGLPTLPWRWLGALLLAAVLVAASWVLLTGSTPKAESTQPTIERAKPRAVPWKSNMAAPADGAVD